MHRLIRLLSLLLGPLLLGTGLVMAQQARNPFRPQEPEAVVEAETVVDQDAELQFCGTFGDGTNKRFLIYNVSTRQSSWLRLNQEGPDELFVESFDAELNAVRVRQGGRQLTLGMEAARVTGGPAVASAPVALVGNSQDLQRTVKVNPTPADERRRLEAVAAEVRRRRAARAAAAAGNPAPAAP